MVDAFNPETMRESVMTEASHHMPRVSIVILNWRAWETTARCIESLKPEPGAEVEVIVVDNASHDGSVAALQRRFPELTILESETNLGFAGGCNIGIRMATKRGADFVWLLNNDVEVRSGALSALLAKATADPRVGAVGSVQYDTCNHQLVRVWGGGYVNFLNGIPASCTHPGELRRLQYLSAASVLLRGQALKETGLLDDQFFLYWEDTDLSFRLRAKGWRLAVAEDSLIHHRGFGSMDPVSATYDYHFTWSSIRFLRKHAPFPPFPIFVSVAGRLAKRLAARRWASAGAVWRAAWTSYPAPSASGIKP